MEEHFLIVGLGNPGNQYEQTRHNVGFRIVKALAQKYAISFRPALVRAKGSYGKGIIYEKKVSLVLPLTYMNESGLSVRKCVDYNKVPLENLLVVTDDVALPFGKLRIRIKGSCGGHNGLRSVEAYLGTQEYTRLRVGVGSHGEQELSDYVLGTFSQDELREMPNVVDHAIHTIEVWLSQGTQAAVLTANRAGE